MTNKLLEALQNVETTYGELISISNDMTAELFAPANALISQIEVCLTSLPIDSIRDFLVSTIEGRNFDIDALPDDILLDE